jgi:chaperonin GroEL
LIIDFGFVLFESILTVSYFLFVFQFGWGWDAAANEFCDLMERGVIDPAKVTINAIDNSASVAGMVLTTECLVTEIPISMSEEDKQRMFDQSAMGAGMQQ